MIQREPHPSMLTEREREMGCWVISGDELEPGDVLLFLGETHRVDRLTPAGASRTLEIVYPEEAVRLIWADGGEYTWAVPSQTYRILPRVEVSP